MSISEFSNLRKECKRAPIILFSFPYSFSGPPKEQNLDYRLVTVGFQECIEAVARYLSHDEGILPHNPFHVRLMSYLQSQASQLSFTALKHHLVTSREPTPVAGIAQAPPSQSQSTSAHAQPLSSPGWQNSCPPTPTLSPTTFTIPSLTHQPPQLTSARPSRAFPVQSLPDPNTMQQSFPSIIAVPAHTQLPSAPIAGIVSSRQETKPGGVYNWRDVIAIPSGRNVIPIPSRSTTDVTPSSYLAS